MIIYEAIGFWARAWGWHRFEHHYLYFPRCQAVHSFGLRQPLWLLWVDQHGGAQGGWRKLKPNCISWQPRAYGVIEAAHPPHGMPAAGWQQATKYWVQGCWR